MGVHLALRYEAIHTSWAAAREFCPSKFRLRLAPPYANVVISNASP